MKLRTFLDYYQPLDSEEKIDKMFELCFDGMYQSVDSTACMEIMDVISEYIKPYFLVKKEELENHIAQLKKERNKRKIQKKRAPKGRRHSPSVYNKDELVYKRINIISTAM